MKKIVLLFCPLLFMIFSAKSQVNDLGVFGGISYYQGDVNPTKHFYNPKPAAGIIHRHTFNSRMALRNTLVRQVLAGQDADFEDEYRQHRDHAFQTTLYAFASQMELDYFPSWHEGQDYKKVTPYLAFGFGMVYSDDFSSGSVAVMFPAGFGVKAYPTERLTLNLEAQVRPVLSDGIDHLANPYEDTQYMASNQRQVTFMKNNDAYYSIGLMLTYKILNNRHRCPAYGNFYE